MNQGHLPVPGGYNPCKIAAAETAKLKKTGPSGNNTDVQKLKATVQNLESSLSKKNKEIAELKKSKSQENGENSFQTLAEVIARVQALRLNQNPSDDQMVREKVADTARLVRPFIIGYRCSQ